MSYPQAIATGNAVIAAALALVRNAADVDVCGTCADVYGALEQAVVAHLAAITTEQAQGPDIDADTQGPRHDVPSTNPPTA